MIKGLLQLILTLLLGGMAAWLLMDEGQKTWLRMKVGLITQPPTESVAPLPQVQISNPAPTPPPEDIPLKRFGETLVQKFNCLKPATVEISEQTRTQIYSWVDEQGHRHFGDQAPSKAPTDNLTDQYGGELSYFDLSVGSPDGTMAIGLKDRLESDVRAIYQYLTQELGLSHLRKVSLNMKVYTQPELFNQYQAQQAPGLAGAAGFYNALLNEAVVLQRTTDFTLRVARHEATHVIIAGLYGSTPMWFNEGLAEYFADYQSKALSRTMDIPSWRLQSLREGQEQHRLPGLGYFLHLTPAEWRSQSADVMYPMAWSVVAFLFDSAEGRRTLTSIMNHLAANPCSLVRTEQWINDYYPGGWERFHAEWQRWVSRLLVSSG